MDFGVPYIKFTKIQLSDFQKPGMDQRYILSPRDLAALERAAYEDVAYLVDMTEARDGAHVLHFTWGADNPITSFRYLNAFTLQINPLPIDIANNEDADVLMLYGKDFMYQWRDGVIHFYLDSDGSMFTAIETSPNIYVVES